MYGWMDGDNISAIRTSDILSKRESSHHRSPVPFCKGEERRKEGKRRREPFCKLKKKKALAF